MEKTNEESPVRVCAECGHSIDYHQSTNYCTAPWCDCNEFTALQPPPSKARIQQLRARHIQIYERRLKFAEAANKEGAEHHIRVEETTRLLDIWKGMEDKEFTELTHEQRGEVIDAIDSGM